MSKDLRDRTQEEIEANWNGTWREILQREDGSIDIEQLKKELMDFSDMIERLTSLTHQLTRGRLSYPTYPVSTIMFVKQEIEQEEYLEQQQEDLKDGVCSMCGHEFDEEEIAERSEPDNDGNQG